MSDKIEDLKQQVAELQAKLIDAESRAASPQMVLVNGDDVPTGNTVKIRRCTNPWERDEAKQKWADVDVPTFYYHVQLPVSATSHLGACITINGQPYYHGEQYELDMFMLAQVKSMVARCWEHEKSIHGDNENAYRKPTNVVLSPRKAA